LHRRRIDLQNYSRPILWSRQHSYRKAKQEPHSDGSKDQYQALPENPHEAVNVHARAIFFAISEDERLRMSSDFPALTPGR
jgi:hypothetical protein